MISNRIRPSPAFFDLTFRQYQSIYSRAKKDGLAFQLYYYLMSTAAFIHLPTRTSWESFAYTRSKKHRIVASSHELKLSSTHVASIIQNALNTCLIELSRIRMSHRERRWINLLICREAYKLQSKMDQS